MFLNALNSTIVYFVFLLLKFWYWQDIWSSKVKPIFERTIRLLKRRGLVEWYWRKIYILQLKRVSFEAAAKDTIFVVFSLCGSFPILAFTLKCHPFTQGGRGEGFKTRKLTNVRGKLRKLQRTGEALFKTEHFRKLGHLRKIRQKWDNSRLNQILSYRWTEGAIQAPRGWSLAGVPLSRVR